MCLGLAPAVLSLAAGHLGKWETRTAGSIVPVLQTKQLRPPKVTSWVLVLSCRAPLSALSLYPNRRIRMALLEHLPHQVARVLVHWSQHLVL